MNEEIWKPIEGYEGLYEVSNTGRVRSFDRYVKYSNGQIHLHKGKVLSPIKDTDGYLQVVLHCNGKCKTIKVHRLVAQAFIPNPDNLPQINHKDEDKLNNCVENLEWCTAKYNINYGTRNIRRRETLIKNGSWSGLSREEYNKRYYDENKDNIKKYKKKYLKKYYQENKEKILMQKKEYYLKKKEEIQNNVKSLNDQI